MQPLVVIDCGSMVAEHPCGLPLTSLGFLQNKVKNNIPDTGGTFPMVEVGPAIPQGLEIIKKETRKGRRDPRRSRRTEFARRLAYVRKGSRWHFGCQMSGDRCLIKSLSEAPHFQSGPAQSSSIASVEAEASWPSTISIKIRPLGRSGQQGPSPSCLLSMIRSGSASRGR